MKVNLYKECCCLSILPNIQEITNWIYTALKIANKSTLCEISIKFVEPDESKKITQMFLKKDKISDVLAFPTQETLKMYDRSSVYLGDILICPWIINYNKQICIRQAIVHAVLHIVGYTHKKEKDYLKMHVLECKINKILSLLTF